MRPGHLPALPSQSALSRFCSPLRRAVRERQEPGARAGQGGQARCGELLCFPYLALSICVPRAARLTRGLGVTLGGAMKMPDTGGGVMCGKKASLAPGGSCPRALQSGQEDGLCPRIHEGWPGRALLCRPSQGPTPHSWTPRGKAWSLAVVGALGTACSHPTQALQPPLASTCWDPEGEPLGTGRERGLVSCAPARWDTAVRTRPVCGPGPWGGGV